MNCCAGCQQGIGCDGLGALPTAQVAALNDYVVAGSVIEWGGKIYWPDSDDLIGWHSDGEARVKNALWAHGGFSMVDAGNIGSSWSPYISIVVTTRVDFQHLGDVLTTIEGAIWQAGYRPDSQNFWVKSVPPAAQGRANTAQPNAGAGSNPPSGSPSISLPNLPDIFGGSTGSSNSGNPIDRLASWLGIGQTEAALIGGLAVLAGIVVVKKLL